MIRIVQYPVFNGGLDEESVKFKWYDFNDACDKSKTDEPKYWVTRILSSFKREQNNMVTRPNLSTSEFRTIECSDSLDVVMVLGDELQVK